MAGAAAAAAAAMARAVKASGILVQVDPDEFLRMLNRQEDPLIVRAKGGVFRTHWRYLTSYKGLAFFTKAPEPLFLPGRAQVIDAGKIWIPD